MKYRLSTLTLIFLLLSSLFIPFISFITAYPSNNNLKLDASAGTDSMRYIRDPLTYAAYSFPVSNNGSITVIFNTSKVFVASGSGTFELLRIDDDFTIDYERLFISLGNDYATGNEIVSVSWGSGGSMYQFQSSWYPTGFWSDGIGHNITFDYNGLAGSNRGNLYFDGILEAQSGANPAMNTINNINFTGISDESTSISYVGLGVDRIIIKSGGVTRIDDEITNCNQWIFWNNDGYTDSCYDAGVPPDTDTWEIEDIELPIGGTPDNSTDEITGDDGDSDTDDGIFGDDCDYDVNFCGNYNNTSLDGIENTTDTDVGNTNFTSTPQTLFYMFSTPRYNNTDIARAKRLSIILGENYTGIMSITFYVASNLESRRFQPISDNNPAYLVKSRSWQNPVKGMYWLELDSYTLIYGQVYALAVSGDSAGLMINETGNLNPLYTVSGFRPFTIISNYNLFQQNGDIALWIELVYQVIVDEAGVIGDEGQQITTSIPIGSNSVMQNLIYVRGQLGMGDMAGGLFLGLVITMIFIFITALIGARMQQQIPSLVYVLVFMISTTLNTVLGFYPVYTMVLVIFIVAILSASALRNLQSGSGGM